MLTIWKQCLICEDKCCRWDFSNQLFLTREEKEKFPKLNTQHPCFYFSLENLCKIHSDRPFDCRLYPFDIIKIGDKLYWIFWELNCPILKNKKNFEVYLQQHEKEIIPKFTEHLFNYAEFRLEELLTKYQFRVLREVKI